MYSKVPGCANRATINAFYRCIIYNHNLIITGDENQLVVLNVVDSGLKSCLQNISVES